MVQAGAKMAETSTVALVGFAATLSINLAILNALPFPALVCVYIYVFYTRIL